MHTGSSKEELHPSRTPGSCQPELHPRNGASNNGLRTFDAVLLAGCVLLAFQLLGPVLTIPLHIPLNYNEGWNALFDTRAVVPGAGPLYPPAGSFVFNNYPPLGFYLIGALGKYVFGDMIVAGRVVALLSLLASAWMTGLCVRYLGGGLRAALAAALLLLLFVNSYFKKYVAVDDPQWLAHATMLTGLVLLLRNRGVAALVARNLPPARLVCAALLMVAGGFIKHNLIALPLAVTLWLLWQDRRAAIIWLAAAGAALGVGLAAIALLHGQVAFNDILHHRRVFRTGLMKHAISGLAPLLPMVVAAVVHWRSIWRRSSAEGRVSLLFIALFGGIALPTGIFQRMGEGVYYNAHFETLIAVCLAFGLAVSKLCESSARWRTISVGPALLSVFAALPLICAWPWHLPRAWADIHDRTAQAAAWQPMIDRVASVQGPAGCLMISLCWWAGKPSEIDMFNLTESAAVGGPLAAFKAAVARQHFAVLQDDPKSFTHEDAVRQLGYDPIMTLFVKNYRTVLHGPEHTVVLVPMTDDNSGHITPSRPSPVGQ